MALINPVLFGAAPAPTTGDYLVRFIDFDGTILKEQWVNAGQAATAPTPPTHQYLTFDEWNNAFTNIQHDLDVGATYYTTDGKTYLFCRFTANTGLQPTLYFNKATTAQMDIDWGDGTGASIAGSGNVTITKASAYSTQGDYIITLSSAGNLILNRQVALGSHSFTIVKCYLGNHITSLTSAFSAQLALQYIVVPKTVTVISSYAFKSCALEHINIPNGVTSLGLQCFYAASWLRTICLPISCISLGDSIFAYFCGITKINLNDITVIPASAFYYAQALLYVKSRLTISSIGGAAFSDCRALYSISDISEIEVINGQVFNANVNLRSHTIKLGYKLNTISALAFPNTNIITFIILATNPPTLASTNAFTNISPICKIYVPDASVSAYQAATNWVTYASYIYPISELAEYAGTIFFQSNGGNAIKQIKGTVGAVATEPTAPTKTGFTFAGWYKEAALTNAWNWASDVYPATNITLYAKWV